MTWNYNSDNFYKEKITITLNQDGLIPGYRGDINLSGYISYVSAILYSVRTGYKEGALGKELKSKTKISDSYPMSMESGIRKTVVIQGSGGHFGMEVTILYTHLSNPG